MTVRFEEEEEPEEEEEEDELALASCSARSLVKVGLALERIWVVLTLLVQSSVMLRAAKSEVETRTRSIHSTPTALRGWERRQFDYFLEFEYGYVVLTKGKQRTCTHPCHPAVLDCDAVTGAETEFSKVGTLNTLRTDPRPSEVLADGGKVALGLRVLGPRVGKHDVVQVTDVFPTDDTASDGVLDTATDFVALADTVAGNERVRTSGRLSEGQYGQSRCNVVWCGAVEVRS